MPRINPSFDADRVRGTLTIHRTDGEAVSLPLPEGVFPATSHINRMALRPDEHEALLGLDSGRDVTVELRGSRTAAECLGRRQVVYLDQNQWSTLSRWEHGRGGVLEADAAVAERLVSAVEARQIVLAASAGVFVETGPLYGARGTELASTVLAHSRGWQMRNPLHVRLEELRLALEGHDPIAREVFAPNCDEMFASISQAADSSHLTPALAVFSREMVGVLGLYEALIDPESIPDEGGRVAAAGWARGFDDVSKQLRADAASRELTRRVVRSRFALDIADDLARAGLSLGLAPGDVVERLIGPTDLLGHMPFLGRVQEVLFARVRNAGQHWEANDLIDIMFLCCAAGYADVVAGERQTIAYLRQIRNVPVGARLARTLREALDEIDAPETPGPSG